MAQTYGQIWGTNTSEQELLVRPASLIELLRVRYTGHRPTASSQLAYRARNQDGSANQMPHAALNHKHACLTLVRSSTTRPATSICSTWTYKGRNTVSDLLPPCTHIRAEYTADGYS
eukprot:7082316-Prymnesium_polylepis.2